MVLGLQPRCHLVLVKMRKVAEQVLQWIEEGNGLRMPLWLLVNGTSLQAKSWKYICTVKIFIGL